MTKKKGYQIVTRRYVRNRTAELAYDLSRAPAHDRRTNQKPRGNLGHRFGANTAPEMFSASSCARKRCTSSAWLPSRRSRREQSHWAACRQDHSAGCASMKLAGLQRNSREGRISRRLARGTFRFSQWRLPSSNVLSVNRHFTYHLIENPNPGHKSNKLLAAQDSARCDACRAGDCIRSV